MVQLVYSTAPADWATLSMSNDCEKKKKEEEREKKRDKKKEKKKSRVKKYFSNWTKAKRELSCSQTMKK